MSSSFWVCFLRLDKCLSPTSQQRTSTSHPSSPTHPLFIRYSSVIPTFYDRFWVGLTSDHCRVWCRHHPASGMSYLHEIVTYSDTFADGNVTEHNWRFSAKQSAGLFHLWIWKAQWKLFLLRSEKCCWCKIQDAPCEALESLDQMCENMWKQCNCM